MAHAIEIDSSSRTSSPWNSIAYVSVTFIDNLSGRTVPVFDPDIGQTITGVHGTGVVVGRNDVLTAAHVVQAPSWLDQSRFGLKVEVFPGADNSPFSAPYGSYTAKSWNNYKVVVNSDTISLSQSQHDFALLSFSDPIGDRVGRMSLDPGNHNPSPTANETGYPGSGPGMMNATVTYAKDLQFSVYRTSENLGPGSSGGPLWYSDSAGAHVLGVASSGDATSENFASLATPGVMDWLNQQMAANDSLIGANAGNVITLSAPGAFVNTIAMVNSSARTTGLDDTILTAAANLPALLIDGGPGTDVLKVTDGGTINLTKISAVEVLDLRGTLAANTVINMGTDFTTVYLGPKGDSVTITAASAMVTGGAGNDTITVGPGDITIDGGGGIDTIVLPLARSKYHLNSPGSTPSASGVNYTLISVERVQFADTKLALDLAGSAGNTAKMIGAAFGPSHLEPVLNGVGIRLFDQGNSLHDVAEIALGSALFAQITGSRSNEAVVQTLYTNVIGHAPPAAEAQSFVALLQSGMSQADLLVLAANSDLNTRHINLVGLASTGLEYA